MYLPPLNDTNQHISSWEYRRNLLRQRIAAVDADVVCLQEVSPESFDSDFAFMYDLGYDGKELFRKGRFRPATFFKRSRCELVVPSVHKDRTLLTVFRRKQNAATTEENRVVNETGVAVDRSDEGKNWYVLNCHLQAGKQASRRLRQINEGVRGVITIARKLKGASCFSNALIRCPT
jgi:mRNA deadenylase 3'-5' endonuclease subunit Ccr4